MLNSARIGQGGGLFFFPSPPRLALQPPGPFFNPSTSIVMKNAPSNASQSNPWKARFPYIIGFAGLLIGVFGAFAIYGVYAKIEHWDGYKFYMQIGFMGEMAALVLMGLIGMVKPFLVPPEKTKKESLTDATAVLEDVAQALKENASSQPAPQSTAAIGDVDAGAVLREQFEKAMGPHLEQMGSQARSLTESMAGAERNVNSFGRRFEVFQQPLPAKHRDGTSGRVSSANGAPSSNGTS